LSTIKTILSTSIKNVEPDLLNEIPISETRKNSESTTESIKKKSPDSQTINIQPYEYPVLSLPPSSLPLNITKPSNHTLSNSTASNSKHKITSEISIKQSTKEPEKDDAAYETIEELLERIWQNTSIPESSPKKKRKVDLSSYYNDIPYNPLKKKTQSAYMEVIIPTLPTYLYTTPPQPTGYAPVFTQSTTTVKPTKRSYYPKSFNKRKEFKSKHKARKRMHIPKRNFISPKSAGKDFFKEYFPPAEDKKVSTHETKRMKPHRPIPAIILHLVEKRKNEIASLTIPTESSHYRTI